MDTKDNGQPADSYEQRDDLALRSAAGDPIVEPRSTPKSGSQPHPKRPLISESGVTQTKQKGPNHTVNGQSSHSRQTSSNGTKAGQSLEPEPSKSKDNGTRMKIVQVDQSVAGSLPDIIAKRNELFDRLKREQHAEILAKEKPEINVVLDLGLNKEGKPRPEMPVAAKAWESTPGSFLRHVDKDVSSDVVIAKVDGKHLWDLDRPLEFACRVSYVPFSSAEGRNVFWHSSAHVLGEAAECQFNCLLSHGPPVEQGFFYDMAIADGYVFFCVFKRPADRSQASSQRERLGASREQSF